MINNKTILIGMGKPTGPIPVHFLALGNELNKRGYIVHILMHCREPLEEKIDAPQIHFWKWRPKNKWARIYDFFYASRMINQCKPICVISGHRETGSLVFAGFLHRTPIRIIWHHILTSQTDIDDRGLKIKVKIGRMIRIPFFAKMCTTVVGVSKSAITDMETIYKVPKDKLQLLYNSLPDPSQQLMDQSVILTGKEEERLICLGRLDVSKGQDVLIRAISLLTEDFPKIRLFIIGGGPCEKQLYALVDELHLNEHVIFKGVINHETVMKILSSASISIVPSRMDNLPTTAIESLSLGIPVIGTYVGGIPEIVTNHINGILVNVDDPKMLAANIKLLLENNEMRVKMSTNARRSFIEKFEQKPGVKIQADWIDEIISARIILNN